MNDGGRKEEMKENGKRTGLGMSGKEERVKEKEEKDRIME